MLDRPATRRMPDSVLSSPADAKDRLLDEDVATVTAAQFEATFRITGKLGYGAYSDVYSCVHNGTPQALKVLRPGSGLGSVGCLPEVAFFREARALKHLHHDSIVTFKGLLHIPAGVASIGDPRVSHWAIVQELLQGGTLRGVVYRQMVQHRHCYTHKQALQWALDIARALHCCHSSNPMVIHRDLKLENILLTKQGQAKLSDFGLHVMVKQLPTDLVVRASPFGRVSLSIERSKGSGGPSGASQSSSGAAPGGGIMQVQANASAAAEQVATAGVVMGDSADSLRGCAGGRGDKVDAEVTALEPNSHPIQIARERRKSAGSMPVAGMTCRSEGDAACSSAAGGSGATSAAGGDGEGIFRRLSDTAVTQSCARPVPTRRTSLTMQTLRRLSQDPPSGELCMLELTQAGGGLLKVHVPLEPVPGSPYDGMLAQEASEAEPAAAEGGSKHASSGAAAALEVLDGSGSSAFVYTCLQQANTEPDYEVSLADTGSVYSMPAGSVAGSARSVAGATGALPCSAASDVWEDIHDGNDSCLDAEATQWPAELHFHMTTRTGSFMYMAPEVYLSSPYNEKVDIFAFGCILYELVSRVLLLFTETPANCPEDCQVYAAKVAQGYRPHRPKTFPVEVWALVEACWAQQPKDRPSSEEVVARLRKILAAPQTSKRAGGAGSHKGRAADGSAPPKEGHVEGGAQEGGEERAVASCGGCVIS